MPVPVAPGRWPVVGHTPAMVRHRFGFTADLPKHGDVVRIYLGTMPTYFVTSPELTYQVLVTDGAKFAKGAMFDKFRPYVGNGLLLSSGAFHLRQRRLIQPAFHHERISAYAEMMIGAVNELVEKWRPSVVRQIDEDMQGLAVTVVGKTLFSTELGAAAIAEARRSIYTVIKQGMIRALSPAFLEKLPIPGNREFDKAIARMKAVVFQVIADWRAEGVDHGDLLSTLLLAQDEDGAHMSDQQVYDEVLTMLTAGIETTALALAWMFHEIARNPSVERKLFDEIDTVLDGQPLTVADLPKLIYTHQVVNEVLRMYPVWILMRRATSEVSLGGVRIAPGSEVTVSPHMLHFDSRFYREPHRFDPDRWSPERARNVPRGAFIPFGAGVRQCMGNSFAQTEIVIAAATVLSRWRLLPIPDQPVKVKFTSAAYPNRMPMIPISR
ncbi:cytochrome P450 [Kibdelosporangium philippinense]|uniref:Cytochrome P450 n=1 Tax=Kibdelosporangium philippinense TaxID=211113 RepID=A0ABS8ZKH8_9PSEU|nr:cytochrome P450 [Kibdelosporangium philippinense]MCE7006297.1 cytochrome P450 [Kibdelosporangium philippinense]